MAAIAKQLFDWDAVEARSDLDRFFLVRDHLPDERLVQYLEVMRGQGRNDYPVRAMWNALLAGVVFQHPSISALIRELDRNPALLQACGFNVLPVQGKPRVQRVPKEGDPGKPVTAHEAPEAPRRAGSHRLEFFPLSVQRRRVGGGPGVDHRNGGDPARTVDGGAAGLWLPSGL